MAAMYLRDSCGQVICDEEDVKKSRREYFAGLYCSVMGRYNNGYLQELHGERI